MKYRVVAVLAVFAFSSCSDPADPSPIVGIDKKLLTNTNGWVVESSTKEDGQSKRDLFSQYKACVADNVYKFESDGIYAIDEDEKKCETTDPQIKETGNWILNGGTLTLSPNGDLLYQFTVSSLSNDKLVFTYLEIGSNGVVGSVTTITLKPLSGL